MSFDQLTHRRIPIWVNRRRARVLKRFRQLLNSYVTSLECRKPVQELRRSINERMSAAYEMSSLAGISFDMSNAQRHYLAMRSGVYELPLDYDLLENFFWLEIPGLRTQVIELIDRAIGAYDDTKGAAWWNTFNPFYWCGIAVEWIAGMILSALADFGVKGAAETNSRFARNTRRAVGFILFVFAPSVITYIDFLGLRTWFFEIVRRLP